MEFRHFWLSFFDQFADFSGNSGDWTDLRKRPNRAKQEFAANPVQHVLRKSVASITAALSGKGPFFFGLARKRARTPII